jgi:hypothetical protein
MDGFESPKLQLKFDRIVFGQLAGSGPESDPHAPAAMKAAGADWRGAPSAPGADPHRMAAVHATTGPATSESPISVQPATGPSARTVAQVVASAATLNDAPVAVRARIVKFTSGVMGKNWAHVRDGSGSEGDGTNDVLVVTLDDAKVGDVVLVKGIVRTDRDFGSGYAYKVLIDEAKLQR